MSEFDKLPPEQKRSAFVQAAALLVVPSAIITLFVVTATVGYGLWRVEGLIEDTKTIAADTKRNVAKAKMISVDSNRILKIEVQEKDRTIAALTYVLEQQAVPAYRCMSRLIQQGADRPPEFLFTPSAGVIDPETCDQAPKP